MSKAIVAGCVAVSLALAGCGSGSSASGGPVTSLASIVEHKGTVPNQPLVTAALNAAPVTATGSIAPSKQSARGLAAGQSSNAAPGAAATIGCGRGLGWVKDPETEAYLRRLASKLQAGLPKASPVPVFICAKADYGAYFSHDGAMIVSLGMLDKARSEGEIAAVIGHELSHKLLDHAGADLATRELLDATQMATSAGILAGMATEMHGTKTAQGMQYSIRDQAAAQDKMIKAFQYGRYAMTLFDDVADSYNKREHEFQADMLGIDLLSRSNYQPVEMKRMLEYKLKEWEEKQKLESTIADRFGRHMGQTMQTAIVGAILTGSASTVVEAVRDEAIQFGVSEIGRAYTDTHPSPAARIELVSAYLDKHHATAQGSDDNAEFKKVLSSKRMTAIRENYNKFFKALYLQSQGKAGDALQAVQSGLTGPTQKSAAGRYVAYEILKELGRWDDAFKMLQGATPAADAPIAFYSSLATELANRGKVAEAMALLDRAGQHYSSEYIFAPTRVRVMKRLNDQTQLASSLGRCRSAPLKEIVQACDVAALGGSDQIAEERQGQGLFSQSKAANAPSQGVSTILNTIGVKLPGPLF